MVKIYPSESKAVARARERTKKKQMKILIPHNLIIKEYGYYTRNEIVDLLRKYKNKPKAIQFIADMLEE